MHFVSSLSSLRYRSLSDNISWLERQFTLLSELFIFELVLLREALPHPGDLLDNLSDLNAWVLSHDVVSPLSRS